MVKKKIKDTIQKNNLINRGEHIVIGLSGGPDSVCLFSVLKDLSEEMDFALYAVHVNHGFRPGDAEEDQAYVEELCESNGVACIPFVYDCNAIAKERGLSSEEAGRQVRYASFRTVAESLINNGIPAENIKIAVAQNADDQAETVLLRLIRGTGPDGLAGMAYSRMEQNICVIRPLLDTWRYEIEYYCEKNNLQPRIDKTNLQPIYTRNKVRLQLIPYLEENFNPSIMEALGRLSRIAGEDKAYLWQMAEEAYENIKTGEGKMDQEKLRILPQSLKYRVIMKAFQEMGLTQDISSAHLEAAGSILELFGEYREIAFPEGYRFAVRYGEAVALTPISDLMDTYKLTVRIEPVNQTDVLSENGQPSCLEVADGCDTGNHADEKNKMVAPILENCGSGCPDSVVVQTAVFDFDKFTAGQADPGKIEFRSRREGDFLPLNKGRKKLQDYFIDEKVPKECREQVKFAAIGSEILWIPKQPELGVKKSRYNPKYKLETDTKKTLKLELICEI